MVGSTDSLDFCTEIPVTEKNVIPLNCWHDVSLSNIWIPSHLLLNRSKPRNRVPQGIYHTLEKKDSSKYAKSFSMYSFSDNEIEQGEIFVSDSDDDNIGSGSTNFEKIHASNNALPTVADHACSNDLESLSNSVKDILDGTPEKSMKDFAFEYKKGEDPTLLCSYESKRERKIKKNKKDKGKRKASNYITLDSFLDTNTDTSQDYYCDKYLQTLLNEKHKNSHVPVASNIEFPDLAFKGFKFIHSEKKRKENDVKSTNLRCDYKSEEIVDVEEVKQCNIASNVEFPDSAFEGYEFIHSEKDRKENDVKSTNHTCNYNKSEEIDENENIVEVEEVKQCATYGKLVIENIPPDVTRDDISVILCGYGEIKKFSLVPVRNFLTAYVEIDMTCDINWIVECLNGSDPFGASTETIRCYKE